MPTPQEADGGLAATEAAVRTSMPAVPGPQVSGQRAQPGRAEALEALRAQMAALRLPPASEPLVCCAAAIDDLLKPSQPAADTCAD